jgi:hypothetical protein
MKHLKLFVFMLAPLFMIVLGYLFLLPMPPPPPAEPGTIGVVILDPVDRHLMDEYADTLPVLAELRPVGMCGEVIPNSAESMDEAIREILTGKDPTKLMVTPHMFDPDTYSVISRSPWQTLDGDMMSVLQRYGVTLKTVMPFAGLENDTIEQPDKAVSETWFSEISDTDEADVILVYVPQMELTGYDYMRLINDTLLPYRDIINTWILVSPMHHRRVTWRFHINQWLLQNGFLTLTEDGRTDYGASTAFYVDYPDNGEPGLRVNRYLSYSSGIVSRDKYEEVRKELGQKVRRIRVPIPGADDARGGLLFTGVYRGEQEYIFRREGMFPEIIWEQRDKSVDISGQLLTHPDQNPWQPVPENMVIKRPGGWMCLFGAAFDIIVQDESELDILMAADVMPTVMFLLNLPVANDMQGRVLQPLMTNLLQLRIPAEIEGYSVHDPLVQQEF